MAILRNLNSGDFKVSYQWRLGILKVAILRRLKSGDFKGS